MMSSVFVETTRFYKVIPPQLSLCFLITILFSCIPYFFYLADCHFIVLLCHPHYSECGLLFADCKLMLGATERLPKSYRGNLNGNFGPDKERLGCGEMPLKPYKLLSEGLPMPAMNDVFREEALP